MSNLDKALQSLFTSYSEIKVAILFGSIAAGRETYDSDLDLAIATSEPLTIENKQSLVAELVNISGRPIDLIDLNTAPITVFRQALTKGKLIYCLDRSLYAELIKKMIFDQADFMPYRERILNERRRAWISN